MTQQDLIVVTHLSLTIRLGVEAEGAWQIEQESYGYAIPKWTGQD